MLPANQRACVHFLFRATWTNPVPVDVPLSQSLLPPANSIAIE